MLKIKDQVESILKYSRRSRSSDKELLIIYMQKFGMNLSEKQVDTFRRMPSSETIRRIRQKLQESGLYPADQKIKRAREMKEREFHPITPEEIEKVLEWAGVPKEITNDVLKQQTLIKENI